MNQIIVYGSEYGTTKRYAEKLSQLSGIDAIGYEDVKTLQNYSRIIYLGGLYAGGVKGLKRTVKLIPPAAKLLLVTVGLADVTDPENIRNIRQSVSKQVPANLLQNTVLFHLRGGIDYSKLSVLHKTMMTLLYNKAKRLPDEKKTADAAPLLLKPNIPAQGALFCAVCTIWGGSFSGKLGALFIFTAYQQSWRLSAA